MPIVECRQIAAPILFISPMWDSIVPVEMNREALSISRHPSSRLYTGQHGHFEMYTKELEESTAQMKVFLLNVLAPQRGDAHGGPTLVGAWIVAKVWQARLCLCVHISINIADQLENWPENHQIRIQVMR